MIVTKVKENRILCEIFYHEEVNYEFDMLECNGLQL